MKSIEHMLCLGTQIPRQPSDYIPFGEKRELLIGFYAL
jgi:hypothetical protein